MLLLLLLLRMLTVIKMLLTMSLTQSLLVVVDETVRSRIVGQLLQQVIGCLTTHTELVTPGEHINILRCLLPS